MHRPAGDVGAGVVKDGGSTDASAGSDAGLLQGSDGGWAGGNFSYACTPIGVGYADGFFSLETFAGKLYAGQFGYGHEAQSMLYRWAPWELTSPGVTGISESICALRSFQGALYANTESSGDIYRSTDGQNWQRVHDGQDGTIGCGLAVFEDHLYAINYGNQREEHGLILRQDGDRWTTVYDSGSAALYIREIIAYDGLLYAFAVEDRQGRMLWSRDGINWQIQDVANRYFRGHVWNGFLWLGSTDYSADGEVGVWRFDGQEFVKMHSADQRYVTEIEDLDGRLFAGTSNGWKDESGPSVLLMSPDGSQDWQPICTFSETAIWSMAVLDGTLFLGTWDYGGGGAVYRVSQTPIAADRCAAIAANSSWELCESGPNYCAGVFTDGAGCEAFCQSAGLRCTARYGAEPGCQKEPENVQDCAEDNGHESDWCECGPRPGQNNPPRTPDPVGCAPQTGRLAEGSTWTVEVDAHTGDEDSTEPKTDSNLGSQGDNAEFRRFNVARAHNDYWYTSSYQEAGEPDPNGAQWVDYKPNFAALAVGCYRVMAQYRATSARASYAAQYRVLGSRDGDRLIEHVQERGDGEYRSVDLGHHFMCDGSFVRVEDPGPNSITFNRMRFTYVGSNCP